MKVLTNVFKINFCFWVCMYVSVYITCVWEYMGDRREHQFPWS